MKPQDLKPPFAWDEPRITIEDRLFYTFENTPSSFTFSGWQSDQIFGNEQPVFLEYCSGNGAWIAAKASQNSAVNWVAVEKKFMRCRKIWSKSKNYCLENLLIVCGEALHTTERFFPSESIDQIFINFPDPWPKKRHAKYRLIQTPFVNELFRILKKGGKVTLVTDHLGYSEQMIEVFQAHTGFSSIYPAPFYSNTYDDYGTSYFEDLWRSQGKEIRYHQFGKSA